MWNLQKPYTTITITITILVIQLLLSGSIIPIFVKGQSISSIATVKNFGTHLVSLFITATHIKVDVYRKHSKWTGYAVIVREIMNVFFKLFHFKNPSFAAVSYRQVISAVQNKWKDARTVLDAISQALSRLFDGVRVLWRLQIGDLCRYICISFSWNITFSPLPWLSVLPVMHAPSHTELPLIAVLVLSLRPLNSQAAGLLWKIAG